jgi:signal transduction histidine kinase
MKIRTKLLLLLALGTLVPLLLSHFFSGRMVASSMTGLIRDGLSRTTSQVAGRTDDQIQWIVRELAMVVEAIPFESFPPEDLPRALEIPYRQLSYATVVALLDENGRALAPPFSLSGKEAEALGREPVNEDDLARLAEHVPLKLALSATVAFGPVYSSAVSGTPRMVAATAFPVSGGEQRWVLAVEITLVDICKLIDELDIPGQQRSALMDLRGHPVCGNAEEMRAPLADADRIRAMAPGEVAEHSGPDGVGYHGAVAEVGVTGWRLLLEQPQDLALAPVVRALQWTAVWVAVALLIAAFGGIVLARGLTRPLSELEEASTRIAGGDYDRVLEVRSKDEVGRLAEGFNRMTAEIRAWNAELTARVEERTKALREAQEQILQTQKLAAIGELGAGVAHEINNPLTGVIGTAQLMQLDAEPGSEAAESVETIISNAQRVAEVVDALLKISQSQVSPDMKPIDPALVLERAVALFAGRLEEAGIQVQRDVEQGTTIHAVDTDVQLAFHNLVENAFKALSGGGTIKLEVAKVEGGAVRVAVSDDGPGMPEDVRERVFDPFYTTAAPGSGSKGLGLTLVQRVATEHQARIVLDSSESEGTTVTLYFPGVAKLSKV